MTSTLKVLPEMVPIYVVPYRFVVLACNSSTINRHRDFLGSLVVRILGGSKLPAETIVGRKEISLDVET